MFDEATNATSTSPRRVLTRGQVKQIIATLEKAGETSLAVPFRQRLEEVDKAVMTYAASSLSDETVIWGS